ncbi:MAG: cyclic nucleotide-binding domain-containing protein [Bacteriovorax sp.]|nr:cyclic nucleotide-binding domain-containing protein [Bacteriovorax sp.]
MSIARESIKLNPGDYLLHEGEESSEMYYLQSGTLAVFKRKGDKENQIGTIISGELVGEMSFLDKHPRSASVKAMTESILVVVPHEALEATLKALPKWFTALLHTLLDRLRKANARVKI